MQPKSRNLRLLLLLTLLIAASAIFFGLYKDHLFPKRFGVVVPGQIYRSGQISSNLIRKVLRDHHIQLIIDLNGVEPTLPGQSDEILAARELGIDLQRFPLSGDGTGDIHHYAQAVASLVTAQRQGKPILVHCAAGTYRTGGTIAFYRLFYEHRSPAEVIAELKKYDWKQNDTDRLIPYMNQHMAELANELVQMKVLDKVPDPLPKL